MKGITVTAACGLVLGLACAPGCNRHGYRDGYASMSADTPGPVAAASTANARCPMCGGAVDGTTWCDYDGKRVGFCCDDCLTKWRGADRRQQASWWGRCCCR